jgi:hypothetical protein
MTHILQLAVKRSFSENRMIYIIVFGKNKRWFTVACLKPGCHMLALVAGRQVSTHI